MSERVAISYPLTQHLYYCLEELLVSSSFLLDPKLLGRKDHVTQLADSDQHGVLQKYWLYSRINGTLVSVYSRQVQNFGRS